MAISTAQYIDLLFKKLQGVAKTATAAQKSASNESIASPPLLRGDIVWMQSNQIPGTAAVVSGITQGYLTTSRIQCTPDPTVPTIGGVSPTWLTGLTNWISQDFGSTWPVKVWIDNTGAADPTVTGTQIFAPGIGGVGEFFFDPMAGLLNFIGETIPANLTAGKSIFITGYRYVGLLGVTNLPSGTTIGNIQITGNTIASLNTNGDIVLDPDGTGNVVIFSGNLNIPSGNITANYLYGNGYYLTGISGGGGSTYGNANVISLLSDFGNNVISTTGNITGDYFVGNGALLTGIASTPTLTVSNWYTGNIISGNIPNVEFLRFNANSGISVSDLGNNSALVTLGSSFKTWEVSGQDSLVAVGEDTVQFVAGNNIVITTNANAVPQQIAFATSNNITAQTFSASGNVTAGNVVTGNVVSGSVAITATSGDILLSAFANVDVNNRYINNLATPVLPSDAASKSYVDSVAQGLHIHAPANLATTMDLATWLGISSSNVIYNQPGPEGVGATLTFVGNSLTGLDGQSVTSGMRLLVKNQSNAVTNGVYSTTANLYVITRSAQEDQDVDFVGGDFLFVTSGTINADTGWVQTTDNVVIGTSNIVFSQFSGAGTYTAGVGLGLNGNEFYLANTAVAPGSYGSGTEIPVFTVNQQGQLTAANTVTVTAAADNMTGNTLSSNVIYSSLTTVGTLANLSVLGNIIANSSISIVGGGDFIMDGGTISGAVIAGGTF